MRPVTTAIAERARRSANSPSLFDQIGGRSAVTVIVERFRQRLFADTELARQLAPLGQRTLDEGLTAFLTRALDGPAVRETSLAPLIDPLSVWLDVEPFTRAVAHLWMTLLELELDVELKDQVVVAILLEAMTPPH